MLFFAVCLGGGIVFVTFALVSKVGTARLSSSWRAPNITTMKLLHAYEPYFTLSALSYASGINQHQLSHYANGLKRPRPQQRQRIVEGMHKIGRELLSVV